MNVTALYFALALFGFLLFAPEGASVPVVWGVVDARWGRGAGSAVVLDV